MARSQRWNNEILLSQQHDMDTDHSDLWSTEETDLCLSQ